MAENATRCNVSDGDLFIEADPNEFVYVDGPNSGLISVRPGEDWVQGHDTRWVSDDFLRPSDLIFLAGVPYYILDVPTDTRLKLFTVYIGAVQLENYPYRLGRRRSAAAPLINAERVFAAQAYRPTIADEQFRTLADEIFAERDGVEKDPLSGTFVFHAERHDLAPCGHPWESGTCPGCEIEIPF